MNSMYALLKDGVTVLSIPPAFFQLQIRFYGASYPPPEALRLIILGGDAFPLRMYRGKI